MTQLETRLMVNDLFGSLQPEQEQEIRILEVKTNPNLEYLVKEYEKFMEKATGFFKSEELYKKLKFYNNYLTSKNIEEFSLILEKYQRSENFRVSGFYLSKLINDSKDENFTIHTNNLEHLIDDIRYKNTKNITVNGNAGYWVGYEMINGIININGNAKDLVGYSMKNGTITINGNAGLGIGWSMNGGSITVNGNAGYWVGYQMKNGSIIVNGNAKDLVGYSMKNGTIHLNGNYKSLSPNIRGGNIYHKGKLIVENGRRLE